MGWIQERSAGPASSKRRLSKSLSLPCWSITPYTRDSSSSRKFWKLPSSLHVILVIMASDIARFLRKKYLDSLAAEGNPHLSDPILGKLRDIGEKLKANSTALTDYESISSLYDLNNAVTEWRILKDRNKSIKRIFSCHDHVAHMNERSDVNTKRLDEIESSLGASSSSTESSQPKLPLWDGYTFYKPDQITCMEEEVSDEFEKRMFDYLLTPSGDNFKAVGICGMGGSGKTALVKNVLKQKAVADKFKRIIWACLSQLTSKEEIDEWIIKYLLYRLGLDTDVLVDNFDEDGDWLMKELVHQLQKSKNYILVLDDMWQCSDWFTDKFLGKLKEKGGGAVIVTSRRKTVAEKIGDKNKLIHLIPPHSAYKENDFIEDKDLGN